MKVLKGYTLTALMMIGALACIIITYGSMVYIFKADRTLADLIAVALLALLLCVHTFVRYLNQRKMAAEYSEFISHVLESLYTQFDSFIFYFQVMERLKEINPDAKWIARMDEVRASMQDMRELIGTNEEMLDKLKGNFAKHRKEIEAHVTRLSSSHDFLQRKVIDSLNHIVDENILNFQKSAGTTNLMAHSMVYFSYAIPIISDFTRIFNEFSKELVVDIIRRFQEISESSHHITTEIEMNMNDLMDAGRENSLAFIIEEARKLVSNFASFAKNMDEFKTTSLDFANRSVEKLRGIQDIADSIGNIADSIKVLSLNVSIEAANAGEAGKGFQVLSRDLREFTTRTMKFALEVKSRVKDAMNTTEQLKGNYASSQANVFEYLDTIKRSIESFEGIVRESIGRIQQIIGIIRDFSKRIDESIKSVVGKLQYYDITSQEVEHLGMIFQRLFMELYNNQMSGVDVNSMVTDEQSNEMKRDVLRIINEVITTSNERKILTKYESLFGVTVQSEEVIENKAGDRLGKNQNDDVILF